MIFQANALRDLHGSVYSVALTRSAAGPLLDLG